MIGMHQEWMFMTSFNQGDVILVRFPNSDFRTYKKRPALIVQSDSLQTGLPQKIVVPITSNRKISSWLVLPLPRSRGTILYSHGLLNISASAIIWLICQLHDVQYKADKSCDQNE